MMNRLLLISLLFIPIVLSAQIHPAAKKLEQVIDDIPLGVSMREFKIAKPKVKLDPTTDFRVIGEESILSDGVKKATYYLDNEGDKPLYEIIIDFESPATLAAIKKEILGKANHPTETDHWVVYNGGPGKVIIAWTFNSTLVMATDLPKTEWAGDNMFKLPADFPTGNTLPTPEQTAQTDVEPPMPSPNRPKPLPQPLPPVPGNIELIFPETHYAEAVAFTPDESLLLSVGSGQVKFWETTGGKLLRTISLDSSTSTGFRNTMCLQMSSDGHWAVLVEREQLFLINLRTFLIQKSIAVPGNVFEYAIFTPNNNDIIVAGYESENLNNYFVKKANIATDFVSTIRKWVVPTLGTHSIGHLSFNADGSRLLVYDGMVGSWLIDMGTNRLIKATETPLCLHSYLPNGNVLAITGEQENKFNLEELDPVNWKSLRPAVTAFLGEEGFTIHFSAFIKVSPSGQMLLSNGAEYRTFDGNSFALSGLIPFEIPQIGMINASNIGLSPGGDWFIQGLSMIRYDAATGEAIEKYGIKAYHSTDLNKLGNTKDILLNDRILRFDPNGFYVKRFNSPAPDNSAAVLIRSVKDGSFGLAAVDGAGLYVFEISGPEFSYSPLSYVDKVDIRGMRIFDDAEMVGLVCASEAIIIDVKTQQITHRPPMPEGAQLSIFERDEDYYCDLSPDRKKFIYLADQPDSDEDLVRCYDLDQKKVIWEVSVSWMDNLRFTNGGKNVSFTTDGDIWHQLDAKTGVEVSVDKQLPATEWYTTISPSNKLAATRINSENNSSIGRSIALYDMQSKKQTGLLEGHKFMVWSTLFMQDERYLMTQGEDYRIWDTEKKTEVARILLFEDSEDWLITCPDGRFDASEGARQSLYYVKGRDIIPLESLYEGFYTPDLLNQLMAGGELPAPAPPVDINQLKRPPSIKIKYKAEGQRNLEVDDDVTTIQVTQPSVTLEIEALGYEDIVSEIRLFHNGKLMENATRNLVVEDDVPGNTKINRLYTVTLLNGENTFTAVALNSQRTESLPDHLTIQYKNATPGPSTNQGITLHLMVIGIDNYKNPKYNLNYAVADATGFKEAISKNCGTIVTACQQHFISNEQAIKGGITAEMDKIAAQAKQQDVFVLYYAGHGVMSAPSNGKEAEFYLVPYDVTQLYGNDGALAQKGLSAKDLKAFAQKIKAQKQLFILDACQSSGALNTVASRGAAEEKAIAQLARSTGTHWLTSAGSEQFASEFTQLGHGVFTYALLEGLNGAADGNSDGKITVRELDAYLQDQVPELTKKYRGAPQYPSSYGFGQDFPVGVK